MEPAINPNMEKLEMAKSKICKAIDDLLKDEAWIGKDVDTESYYYDPNKGEVLRGAFRNIWKKIALDGFEESFKPKQPMKIEEPLDEDSIIILYGPIKEVTDYGKTEVQQSEPEI